MNPNDFIKIIQKQTKFPKHIRLYIVSKKHFFINNGKLNDGFDSKLVINSDRESALSAFSKMAFIFDELIRIRIVGYTHHQNSIELMYLMNLIPVNRKIRTFLDWNLFSPEFAREMSRLFLVKNYAIQCVSLNEIQYSPNKKFWLSDKKGFNIFKKDMTKAWKNLLNIYGVEQQQISWDLLLKEINL